MRRELILIVIAAVCVGVSTPALAQGGSANPTPFQQAANLRRQGQFEQAAAAFRKIIETQPDNDLAWLNIALCAHGQNDYAGAIEAYAKAATYPRVRPTALYNSACAHALLGHTEPAFEALKGAIAAGFSNASLVRTDADLDSLREDDRLEGIIASIGTPLSRRLHFWIGEWDCYSARTGRINGHNNLVARLNESVIHENWTAVSDGSTGESWNYYDPQTRTWNQHWMSGKGQPAIFVGKPKDSGILFEQSSRGPGGQRVDSRMFVRPIGNGRVQQTGTKSTDGGTTWTPDYDLIYVPRGEPFNAATKAAASTVPDLPARQFDFLIGEWRMDVEQYDAQGKLIRTLSDWSRVRPKIGGASLIDEWGGSGFTVRTYDPKKKVWRLFWTDQNNSAGKMQLWEGTFENGVGTFVGGMGVPSGAKGITSKIEFSEITHDSVLWKMWKSPDGGQTWVLDYIRRYTRTAD